MVKEETAHTAKREWNVKTLQPGSRGGNNKGGREGLCSRRICMSVGYNGQDKSWQVRGVCACGVSPMGTSPGTPLLFSLLFCFTPRRTPHFARAWGLLGSARLEYI